MAGRLQCRKTRFCATRLPSTLSPPALEQRTMCPWGASPPESASGLWNMWSRVRHGGPVSEGRVIKTRKCLKVVVLRERKRERERVQQLSSPLENTWRLWFWDREGERVPVGIASKKKPENCSSERERASLAVGIATKNTWSVWFRRGGESAVGIATKNTWSVWFRKGGGSQQLASPLDIKHTERKSIQQLSVTLENVWRL